MPKQGNRWLHLAWTAEHHMCLPTTKCEVQQQKSNLSCSLSQLLQGCQGHQLSRRALCSGNQDDKVISRCDQ